MDLAELIVSFAVLIVSGGAAVGAVVQARVAESAKVGAEVARNESRLARDEAVQLTAEANESFAKQAAALEESNRLASLAGPIARAEAQHAHMVSCAVALISIVDLEAYVTPDDVIENAKDLTRAFVSLELAAPAQLRNEIRAWGNDSVSRLMDFRTRVLKNNSHSEELAIWCLSVRVVAMSVYEGRPVEEFIMKRRKWESWAVERVAQLRVP